MLLPWGDYAKPALGALPTCCLGLWQESAVQGTMGGMFPLSSSEKHKKMTDWRVPLGDEKGGGGALGSDVAPCSQGGRTVWDTPWVRFAGIQPTLDSF